MATAELRGHPYYPIDTAISGYAPNEKDTLTLVSLFAAICTGVSLLTSLLVKRLKPHISTGDLCTITWFILCSGIHLVLEGYFAYNFRHIASKQHILGQLWKEYSLSDSRYLTQDDFVLCMETVTAVCWGPLSFILAAMIATNHPLRYPLQGVVSLGQLYGDVLYFATCAFDYFIIGAEYSRPEGRYFWGYFAFLNAIWIVVPFSKLLTLLLWLGLTSVVLLCNSIKASGGAFAALERLEKSQAAKKKL